MLTPPTQPQPQPQPSTQSSNSPPPPPLLPTRSGSLHIQLLSLSISLGSFIFSYNTVCLTQLAELLKLKNDLNREEFIYQLSVATSCFNFGTFVSPIFCRKFLGYFGEVKGLLIIDIISILAILTSLIHLQFPILITSRLTLGLAMGLSSTIIPIYNTSIAPPTMISKLGTYNQLAQVISIVCAYVLGYIVVNDVGDQVRWRIYLGVPIFGVLGRIWGVWRYRFQGLDRYIQRGDFGEIRRYCMMVYGNDNEETLTQITTLKNYKKISQNHSTSFHHRFLIAIVLIISNQVSGTNAILYYAKQLFNKITDNNTSISQILIIVMAGIQVIGTLISGSVVDRVGIKKMIVNGQILIGACLLIIVLCNKILVQLLQSQSGTYGIIIFIFLHIFIMNLTMGPLNIVYCTYIVQDITWMVILMKGFTLVIALTSQYMIEYLGIGFMFLIFFGCTLAAYLYLRGRIVEVKGLSSQGIYQVYEKRVMDRNRQKEKRKEKKEKEGKEGSLLESVDDVSQQNIK